MPTTLLTDADTTEAVQPPSLTEYLLRAEYHFELDNNSANISQVLNFLREKMSSQMALDSEEITLVCVALQEALLNAIHHGNLELSSDLRQDDSSLYYDLAEARRVMWPYCDRKVQFQASLARERLKFVIRDEGPGFDTNKVADPTAEENLERPSGRGLLMIRSFMDEVSYNESGNCITMLKYKSPGQQLLAELNGESDDLEVSGGVLLFDYSEL